jgi:hypothetical protein
MKTKFENIKGMLRREEMKEIIGGNVYGVNGGGSTGPVFASGTTLSGSQNANLGVTITSGTNYSTTYNYGAGMNGGSASGYSSADTYNNAGSTSNGTTSGYARP